MKFTNKPRQFSSATAFFSLLTALIVGGWPATLQAQRIVNRFPPGMPMPMPPMNSDNNSSQKTDSGGKGSGPWIPSESLTAADSTGSTNDIQLSFQGANIDMIVQWLAQTTGKSVIKSAQVQCQLTINSSKKMPPREALNLVYRALALEGYSVIEFKNSIMIVPQGKEPQMSPELLDSSSTNVPEGNQRLMKVFSLKHLQASEVKDRLSTVLSDKATVFVDEQVNQIIITDYNDNLRAASRLIAALDTDTPDDVTVRVLPLKNMSAADLVKEVGPLYQKNGGSSKDSVQISADQQSNALLILSSAANFSVIQQFVASLDTEQAQDKVMRTFTLKNADAQDVAKQLQDLNNSAGSVTTRYFYNFGGSDNNNDTKKMTVVADRRRNAVIIQAPPAQMDAIGKTVEELDAPVNDGSLAPKIYPMKYVSAADIEDVLNELFLKKTQQRAYWDFFGDDSDTSTPDRDVGRLYGKVRITSEPYSNALIVTANSQENLMAVETIINQLDQPSEAAESTLHIGLRFAKADTLANSINVLFAKNGSPPLRSTPQNNQNNQNNQSDPSQQNTQTTPASTGFDLSTETKLDGYYPWLGGQPDNTGSRSSSNDRGTPRPVSDLVGRVRAIADNRSNALLISANVHFFPQILKLIDSLDQQADQVMIEARLVNVSSDFLDQLGVRYSPNGAQEFSGDDLDNSIIANVAANYVKGFGGNTTVNTPSTSVGDITQALASLRSGVLSSSVSMDFLIQFLHRTTDATVIAEPQLNIRDNETGKLFVGQEVPIPANNQVSSVGSSTTSITYKEVGVTLEVTPHINNSGDVELKIHAGSSTVVPGQVVLGGAVFNTANFRTDLTAKDGQTLVLGGIIQKQTSNLTRKTPWLGDIPGLGWAFKNKDNSSQEVELMVFLRPHVLHTPEDAKQILNDIGKQAPLVKKWYDEQHTNEIPHDASPEKSDK
ncbi:MAG TPA: secretin N-terminal domain-containing protein [Verrucomicrobiae bacterium]|jgi:type II secretion system protein D